MGRAVEVIQRLAGKAARERLEQRAARLASEDLMSWADQATLAVGRAFGDFYREGRSDSLDEARLGAASLVVVLEEIEARRSSGRL